MAPGRKGSGCPSRPLYVRNPVPAAGRLLASATPRRPISPLGDSLTVELPALDRTAQVRILVPQPSPRTLDGPATGLGLIVGSIWDLFDRICSRNVQVYGKPPCKRHFPASGTAGFSRGIRLYGKQFLSVHWRKGQPTLLRRGPKAQSPPLQSWRRSHSAHGPSPSASPRRPRRARRPPSASCS